MILEAIFWAVWAVGVILWLTAWTTHTINLLFLYMGVSANYRPVHFWRWFIPLVGGAVGVVAVHL